MCIVCKNKAAANELTLDTLKSSLNCSTCHEIETLPQIEGINRIDCDSCLLIRKIPHINSLKELSCNRCPLLRKIPQIDGLHTLRCNVCPLIEQIPRINTIKKLECCYCPIKTIYLTKNLYDLGCTGCNLLEEIKQSKNPLIELQPQVFKLWNLICRNCPQLKKIPHINTIKYLYCDGCPLISEIPHIVDLVHLDCSGCSLIEKIPQFNNLQNLICSNCTSLKVIPQIPHLRVLYCRDCPFLELIPAQLTDLISLRFDGCPFLYIPYKIRVNCGIKKPNYLIFQLRGVQRRYRLKVLARKLLNQIPGNIGDLNNLIVNYI